MAPAALAHAMLPRLAELQSLVAGVTQATLLPLLKRAEVAFKADGSLVTAADTALQRALRDALRQRWPRFAFLAEEMPPAEQARRLRQADHGVWCLDPLDGTTNFAAGLPLFCVSLALLVEGEAVCGLIYDPSRDECFAAIRGGGARLDGVPLSSPDQPRQLAESIALVDFKRLPKRLAHRLASAAPCRSLRSLGSGALEWCWIAAGRAHVYVHGAQRLWDYSAGSLILAEAGGLSATLERQPLRGTDLTPRSVVAAGSPELFQQWQQWLADSHETEA